VEFGEEMKVKGELLGMWETEKGEEGRGKGEERVIEKVNVIKEHYMHVWKYHNETHNFVKLIDAKKT
jgi:hypothetical protein